MSEVEVRVARPDEYESIGAITVAGYAADGYLTLPDGSADRDYSRWLRDASRRGRDGVLLVSVLDDKVVGTATWCPSGSPFRELAKDDSQGEFRSLSVLPEGRGRGVGRALVRWCIDRAIDDGLTELVLSSLPDMTPAHRLYESVGFDRRPDLDWSPHPGLILWGFSLGLCGGSTLRP